MEKNFREYLRENSYIIEDKSEIPNLDDLKISEKLYSTEGMIDAIVKSLFDPSLIIVTTDLSKIYLGTRGSPPSKGRDHMFDFLSTLRRNRTHIDIKEKDAISRAYERARKAHVDVEELMDYTDNEDLTARLKGIDKYFKLSRRDIVRYRRDLGDFAYPSEK